MRVLVTAGNTLVPIDRVRCLTNVFTGRTGAAIAQAAHHRGHDVTLLTSHPERIEAQTGPPHGSSWSVISYRTFEDLEGQLARAAVGDLDAVVHCAAVSDYRAAGIFAPAPGTHFRPESGRWDGPAPRLEDRAAGKVKSDEPELWLRLVRTPKLIDRFRADWGFRGVLVKFKLEVGVGDDELLRVAERSRRHSAADFMVANTLEGAADWAYLGPLGGAYERVDRPALAERLLEAIEALHRERAHG
jgi:phosphopantothenoylcysteine synthetase/decarboxylase